MTTRKTPTKTKSPFEPAAKPTTAAPRPGDGMRYPTPLMNSIGNGAVLDQRMALAMQLTLAQASAGFMPGDVTSVRHVLDCADRLYAQAEARGWVQPLPNDDFLPQAEVAHIRRQVKAQLEGQSTAQAYATAAQAQLNPTGRAQ